MDKCSLELAAVEPSLKENDFRRPPMHWRKVPGKANGKVFYYVVVSVLIAAVALTTTLLALHFHA
jgi:hypothetical protein